jgi:hypothetical protein
MNASMIWADSLGASVPRARLNGTVHSVFPRACNVLLEDSHVISLLAPEVGRSAHGIRVSAGRAMRFDHIVGAGDRVQLNERSASFGARGLEVQLESALPWRDALAAAAIQPGTEKFGRLYPEVRAALERGAAGLGCVFLDTAALDSSGDAVARAAAKIAAKQVPRLARATAALNAEVAGSAASRLVGMGTGFTPAGDDFLIGWLAALALARGDDAGRIEFLSEFAERVSALRALTHPVSAQHLEDACQLRFSERLADFAAGLASGEPLWREPLHRLLAVGHSSGADAAAGLLTALPLWAGS